MRFTRELNLMVTFVLIAFGAVALAAVYWSVVGPDTLLQRDDNPRLVEDAIRLRRGAIVDRRGALLVESTADEGGIVTRHYYYPETASATGYFSFRYGVSGAEAAYDTILTGGTRPTALSEVLLHQPRMGDDIQLTFDLQVQQAIVEALGSHQGAVVVLAVPSGDVLALVSLPSFDPNTLDEFWNQLAQDTGKPFFNRVLQGNYQPGGLLQTSLLAAALADSVTLDTVYTNATMPVQLEDVTLRCVGSPAGFSLTLADAFNYTCPAPFVQVVNTLGQDTVEAVFANFQLGQPPTLPGFIPEADSPEATPQPTIQQATSDFLATALGQGDLTVSPLQMALVAAAIINDGNAPQPNALLATRLPQETDWIDSRITRPTLPFMTGTTAEQLRTVMLDAVQNGAAQAASQPNLATGGHVALAYSGEGTQAWFIGFTPSDSGSGIAVAVVIENSEDTDLAAQIGGTALGSAFAALNEAGN